MVRFERAQRAPVSGGCDGGTNPHWTLVGVARRFELGSPVLDMVASARVDLYEIPVIRAVVFDHRFGKTLRAPLAQVIVSPEADGNTIYLLATQRRIHSLTFIHRAPAPF